MKAKIGVVIHKKLRPTIFLPEDEARLNALGQVRWTDSEDPVTVAQAIEILHDCTVAIGSWGTPRPCEELLAACPQLRLWENAAGSVRHMFGPHLEGRDLIIASCRQAIAENVAEQTIGSLILGLRRTYENAAANRKGRAARPANVKSLNTSVIGIVGASEVGKRVIRHLRHFGARVLLYDPYVTDERAREMGVTICRDLAAMCAQCDAVSLQTPALPSTEKMMTAPQFRAMPDDCVFVNTARGMCVDEAALIDELEKGRLTAYLDVTFPEPPAEDSPLRRLPNVIYTSHTAGYAVLNVGRQAVDDVEAFLAGRHPLDVITADMLDRIA